MATSSKSRSHKHFRLNAQQIKRAQRALGAVTETETIERALALAISENDRNRLAEEAHDRFLRSGIEIKDVYGALED
jgi:hypothetical protein